MSINCTAWLKRTQLLAKAALVTAAALCVAAPAQAAYPERPVRLVVGFAPGGSDISARLVAQKLSELWGQPIVVENRPGAGGNIGATQVSRAEPDGYTILLMVNSYTINTTVYQDLPWDLLKSFEPLGRYAQSPMVAVVNANLPVKNLAEFVEYAKSRPGQLNYGSAGTGTAPHLAVEVFADQTGLKLTHIPYKGSGPSVTALAADEVQLAFGAMSAFSALINDGRLRPLAVTTAERFSQQPEVPTVVESKVGIDEFDLNISYGFLAPAGTPKEIVQKFSDDLGKVMQDPELQDALRQRGLDPVYIDHEKTGELMKKEVEFWAKIAKRLDLRLN